MTPAVLHPDTRRSDYDVTDTVKVSFAIEVRDAVRGLCVATWPGQPFTPIARAFRDLELAFLGRMPGYCAIDTVYHNQQHTLDVTLVDAFGLPLPDAWLFAAPPGACLLHSDFACPPLPLCLSSWTATPSAMESSIVSSPASRN